jgi:hypothetical protein
MDYTNDLLKGKKKEWAKHVCSIMLDGWTNRRNRSIINFIINCSLGFMFIESIDGSSFENPVRRHLSYLDLWSKLERAMLSM